VIQVRPVVKGLPFPTLYWLTCPFLVRAIDRLEATGWVKRLEGLLAEDPALAAALRRAHAEYIAERLDLLPECERAELEARGMLEALRDRGIGGIADPRRLKCLHLHAAHALARSNPIGDRVLELLPERECPEGEMICSAREERSRSANDRRSS